LIYFVFVFFSVTFLPRGKQPLPFLSFALFFELPTQTKCAWCNARENAWCAKSHGGTGGGGAAAVLLLLLI